MAAVTPQDAASPLPDGMTGEAVREYQAKWGLSDVAAGYGMALSWLTVLLDTYYAMAFMVPFTIAGTEGCILVTSTAQSARVYAHNCEEYQQTNMITDPHWQYFEVFWYTGLALFNFYDLAYGNGMKMGENLAEFLDRYAGPLWKQQYCNIRGGGMFLETFRRLLREVCGVANWLEISVGRSYQQFRALDFYVRCISAGMKDPTHEAWYLLNASGNVFTREEPAPERWWWYFELRSWGQRRVMTEWYLEVTSAVMTASAARRITHVLRHVYPEGIPQRNVLALPEVLARSVEHLSEVQEVAHGVARIPAAAAKSRS